METALSGLSDCNDGGRTGNYRARGCSSGTGHERTRGDSASHGGGVDDSLEIDDNRTNFRKRGIEQDGGLPGRRDVIENAVRVGAREQVTVRAGSERSDVGLTGFIVEIRRAGGRINAVDAAWLACGHEQRAIGCRLYGPNIFGGCAPDLARISILDCIDTAIGRCAGIQNSLRVCIQRKNFRLLGGPDHGRLAAGTKFIKLAGMPGSRINTAVRCGGEGP